MIQHHYTSVRSLERTDEYER